MGGSELPERWLRCSYFTNKGLKKSRNEDALLVGNQLIQCDLTEPCEIDFDASKGTPFVVADGLGAHDDAQLASRTVISEIAKRTEDLSSTASIEITLEEINRSMYREIERRKHRRPMGATMAGSVFVDDEVLVFSVGDCAIYYSGATLFRVFTPQRRPDGKSVEDCFGGLKTHEPVRPAVRSIPWLRTSRVLIATDGLYDSVSEGEILSLLQNAGRETLASLWDKAKITGARDNLSMILVQNVTSVGRE